MPRNEQYVGLSLEESQQLFGIVGIVGTLLYLTIIACYVKLPKIRNYHPAAYLIIWHSSCGFMISIGFVMSSIVLPYMNSSNSVVARFQCRQLAVYNQFFLYAGASWHFIMSLDLLIALFNPWISHTVKLFVYHVWTWIGAFITSVVLWHSNDVGLSSLNMFWIKKTPLAISVNHLNWVLFYGPVMFYIAMSNIVLLLATFRFRRRQHDLTHRTKRRCLLQYFRYCLLYSVYWTALGVIYYFDYREYFDSRKLHVAFCMVFGIYPLFLLFAFGANSDLMLHIARSECNVTRINESTDHVSVTLRKDLMRYATAGILESIQDGTRHQLLNLHNLTGPIGHPQQSSQSYSEKKRLSTNIIMESGQEDMRYYEKLGFTDYAPSVFQAIRQLCAIDEASYRQSFQDGQELVERNSEGKSGMIFYFTKDHRYVVKTMTKEEHTFLLDILPSYHRYIEEYPDTFLCRFLGCHSLQLPFGWNKMFFVVMENIIATPPGTLEPHERYDLKGIYTAIQDPSPSTSNESSWLMEHASSTKLLYDTSFVHRNAQLRLQPSLRANVLSQITSDCKFLQRCNIMDYSLLVGVQNTNLEVDRYRPYSNVLLSQDQKTAYYLGFVDILQHYDFGWQCQHWFLSLLKNVNSITAIPPAEYALRLVSFAHTHLIANDDHRTGVTTRGAIGIHQQQYGSNL